MIALQGAQLVSWVGSEWRQHLHCLPPSFDRTQSSKCALHELGLHLR